LFGLATVVDKVCALFCAQLFAAALSENEAERIEDVAFSAPVWSKNYVEFLAEVELGVFSEAFEPVHDESFDAGFVRQGGDDLLDLITCLHELFFV